MIIKCLSNGMFNSNSYIIGHNGEGIIIDAGVKTEEIILVTKQNKLKIKYIILTHGHIDHICELNHLYKETNAKILIHEDDVKSLKDKRINLSFYLGQEFAFNGQVNLLKGEEFFEMGEQKVEIIHTPGHSKGSICIKINDKIFTGDTLFKRCIGRTDLYDGNYEEIINSINNKIMKLDDGITLYPGHGEDTT